ncbi:extracellular solute-binding protein [Sabulicella glaciei]|uniref:Extracellular solute-binding protein n=1 Tax=Sabulicella glaciei TaxID=2984948 RepID=A0ABT3NRG1_9PROT|nr:extracellular solute-binding protein [Roseococcus sp. MDT2-1-1]MCW8084749.1 extracellular solute-binding protein [Roseococcus sp. MDT2-1-1]
MLRRSLLAAIPAALAAPRLASAQERVVNLYSSRHYDSDRALYETFAQQSGIRIRLIEANADQLLERIRAEGANSPADVILTVDASRLARAAEMGLTQPVRSDVVASRVPAELIGPEGMWFAVSRRARVLMYDRARGAPEGLARYEDMADPRFRGQFLIRSSGNGYNIALASSFLAVNGEAATEAWARGIAANLARPPSGGDTDQIRAMLAGQGRIALANTYYLGLLRNSQRAEDKDLAGRVAVIFPNQGDRGTHVNISGAALVRTAPNAENARRFLDFLTTPEAQRIFALGNMEYPAVSEAETHPFLVSLGQFKAERPDSAKLLANAPEALRIMQRAGWR